MVIFHEKPTDRTLRDSFAAQLRDQYERVARSSDNRAPLSVLIGAHTSIGLEPYFDKDLLEGHISFDHDEAAFAQMLVDSAGDVDGHSNLDAVEEGIPNQPPLSVTLFPGRDASYHGPEEALARKQNKFLAAVKERVDNYLRARPAVAPTVSIEGGP